MNITREALLYIAAPIIKNVILEIAKATVTNDNLRSIKNRFYKGLAGVTGQTKFSIDDTLAMAAFNGVTCRESIEQGGDLILDAIEEWIASTTTRWDDTLIKPVIDVLREVAGIPDGDEQ